MSSQKSLNVACLTASKSVQTKPRDGKFVRCVTREKTIGENKRKKSWGVWEWLVQALYESSKWGGGVQYANPCLPTVAACGQLFQFVSINPTITGTTPPGGKPGQLISDDGDGREKSSSVHTLSCEEGRKEGRKEGRRSCRALPTFR